MPLPLSSTAITEKNKLANSDSVFLVALEITVPGLETPIRVIANTEDITWRAQTWLACPFELDEISESMTEVPRVEVRVSNVSREMELYLHEYDRYCKLNGYAPIVFKIFVVNSLNLASNDPEVEHEFLLLQPKTNAQWATFTLGASNPWNRRYPQRRLLPSCPWRFKVTQRVGGSVVQICQYAGAEAVCDKTIARCRELSNTSRFGGLYAIGRPN